MILKTKKKKKNLNLFIFKQNVRTRKKRSKVEASCPQYASTFVSYLTHLAFASERRFMPWTFKCPAFHEIVYTGNDYQEETQIGDGYYEEETYGNAS